MPATAQPLVEMKSAAEHIALIGSFPPRRCGLATFTRDTRDALVDSGRSVHVDVLAMDDGADPDGVWEPGVRKIAQDDAAGYLRAADAINASGVKQVWLQHEFGLFGGPDGEYILSLVDRIAAPLTVTMHTIVQNPSPGQRRIMEHLVAKAAHLVVMAQTGRRLLIEVYGADRAKITVIPHGIPDMTYVEPESAKPALGFEGRSVILTFGLLSPDKGIDDMIEAMPHVVAACPDALYVILGATHPHIVKHSGEALRHGLEARAAELGLTDHVHFVDSYVDMDLLTAYLRAADCYVTPYRNPDQITSGTLSYAVGLGKPVVSTPYVHARELLSDGTGIIVPFRDPGALGRAVAEVLVDPARRKELAGRAYRAGRPMIWAHYGAAALELWAPVPPPRARLAHKSSMSIRLPPGAPAPQAETSYAALVRMTDDTGLAQHGRFGVADRRHGYCIDDNARALALVSIARDLPAEVEARLSHVYAAFIQYAWNNDVGQFRNFMHFDRRWLEDAGSADSNGRTLHALSLAATHHRDPLIREWAVEMYREAAEQLHWLHSPRAIAFAVSAGCEMARGGLGNDSSDAAIRRGAAALLGLLERNRRPEWNWFEPVLAYDNCRLAQALIEAGAQLGDDALVDQGLGALDWVMRLQICDNGQFRPVGSESFGRPYAQPLPFDQQPVEAAAAIEACLIAQQVAPDPRWALWGEAAFAWFLGANDLGQPLADAATGECRDGLNPAGRNHNRGAESILAWQLAMRRIAELRAIPGEAEGGFLYA